MYHIARLSFAKTITRNACHMKSAVKGVFIVLSVLYK